MKNTLFILTAFILAAAATSTVNASIPSTRVICKPIKFSSYREGTLCAEVKTTAKRITLTDIHYTDRYEENSAAPVRFRRGSADQICARFNAKPEAVAVEIFHAKGVDVPGIGTRVLAANGAQYTSYDEIACIR